MEPSEFYTMVRQQAELESVEEAEELSEPVLRTLGERLSAGQIDDLVGFLPDEIATELETDAESGSEPEAFGPEEFVDRVAERADADDELARRVTRATTDALAEAAPGEEYRNARQQLPEGYGTLFQETEDAEERTL